MVNPNPSPFQDFKNPNSGLAPNLVPTPPAAMPEPPAPPDATDELYPFSQAQDVDSIIARTTIERPLPLYIPPELKHPGMEYHIINDTPQEMAAALRRNWQPVDKQELLRLFEGRVSGSDKSGKITRPILMARDRRIGQHEAMLKRRKLVELNKGMDPKNKQFNSKYAEQAASDTKGVFTGTGMGNIKGT